MRPIGAERSSRAAGPDRTRSCRKDGSMRYAGPKASRPAARRARATPRSRNPSTSADGGSPAAGPATARAGRAAPRTRGAGGAGAPGASSDGAEPPAPMLQGSIRERTEKDTPAFGEHRGSTDPFSFQIEINGLRRLPYTVMRNRDGSCWKKGLDAVHKTRYVAFRHHRDVSPPQSSFGESAGALRPGFFFSASGEGGPRYVFDASKMLAMDASSIASNSSSVCCAVSPSVRAREKLATTPWLRAIRALASSRV